MIAEVIAGILLGPSVMFRIPGFQGAIFPTASMPALTLAANLGLVLFLFLVGLEVDLRFLASNWRIALSVGAAGMALPFGLGCAIAWGLYHQFRNEPSIKPISFGVYALFIGVAMAITAFPVLCRILTELKLLQTPVGVVVLSAGVGNDVVGWILLALCVALVNSGAGVTALWILMVAIGYALFLVFAVRPVFLSVLRRTRSLENGPTQAVVALTVLMVLASAFFTGVIGIHPIFGAFMVGLICPHEGGFAIKLTEKIEDLVSVLFLPLYFALSGLSTNLGLLDTGITWAYVIGVTAIAFVAKILGGTLASWLNGLVWRESLTIGVLMSCKGLVELIVLNIGLQANILSQRTFTIFVVMALITTFATTPLTTLLYPVWYQQKLDLWKKGKIDWDGNVILSEDSSNDRVRGTMELTRVTVVQNALLYLRLDGLPGLFSLMSLLGDRPSFTTPIARQRHGLRTGTIQDKSQSLAASKPLHRPLQLHGLRLLELTERDSSVMAVSELHEYADRDPVIKAFRTIGESNQLVVAGSVAVVPEHSYAGTLLNRAIEVSSDLVIIPWSETGSMAEQPSIFMTQQASNPLVNGPFSSFVEETFETAAKINVAVYIDHRNAMANSFSPPPSRALTRSMTGMSLHSQSGQARPAKPRQRRQHILVVFFGGENDSFAVRLALQLAKNEEVIATILSMAPTLSSHDKTQKRTDNDTFFLSSVESNLPEHLKSRVVFETSDSEPDTAIASTIQGLEGVNQEDDSIEHIIVTGVGLGPTTKAMGLVPTTILTELWAKQLPVSLLVVQAKRECEHDEELVLKKSSIPDTKLTAIGSY